MFQIKIVYMDNKTESYPADEVEALKPILEQGMDARNTKMFLHMRIADVLERGAMTVQEDKVINLRNVRFIKILPK